MFLQNYQIHHHQNYSHFNNLIIIIIINYLNSFIFIHYHQLILLFQISLYQYPFFNYNFF